MLNRVQLKQEARDILRGAAMSPWLFALALMALLAVLNGADAYVSGSYIDTLRRYLPEEMIPAYLLRTPAVPALAATFISVLTTLLSTVLRAGGNIYHLGVRQGREMPLSTLLDGFYIAGRVILLAIIETVLILLWSLLLIIPGIIAAYRYRFAILNLLENPELSPLDAISMSKAQTYGYKLDLFVLDLSFLGWLILCGLTFGVLYIWVGPYISQTNVGAFWAVKRATGIGYLPQSPSSDDGFAPFA